MKFSFVTTSATFVALMLSACGSSETPGAIEQSGDSTTTTEAATTTTVDEFDIRDLEQSVVRISVAGEFSYPFEGSFIESGGGSGYIISDDGLVLTNHHVVSGAAVITVSSSDGEDEVAQLLGVSECDDLAVLRLPSASYTSIPIAIEVPPAGTEIYAAGYPESGDFEESPYTLTKGIVSTVRPGVATYWAAVGDEIEHDANIRGGSSGGPLVTLDGEVIGLNYASIDEIDTNYAIALPQKRSIIDRLIAGDDVNSLGLNGGVLLADESEIGIEGIWVYGVESGSPADAMGLEPGDLIMSIEGLPATEDGTMSTYCDVIQTRGADSAISIQVYRSRTDEYLAGQFNGRELEERAGLADEFAGLLTGPAEPYEEYVIVIDDSGQIEVEVPAEWSDVNGAYDDEFGGPSIWASTDLDEFFELFGVPGVAIDTTRDSSQNMYRILNDVDYSGDCIDNGVVEYDDGIYSGYTRLWSDCPGGSSILVLAAIPDSQRFIVRLEAQVVTDADFEALDRILSTFYVYED